MSEKITGSSPPSIEQWFKEAKADSNAAKVGMYLLHNGVVRQTPKAEVRQGLANGTTVERLEFSYDAAGVEQVIQETLRMEGIFFVRVWLNEGMLEVGDDIMYVLIGGDIRPHVIDALQFLLGKIKGEHVTEKEYGA